MIIMLGCIAVSLAWEVISFMEDSVYNVLNGGMKDGN